MIKTKAISFCRLETGKVNLPYKLKFSNQALTFSWFYPVPQSKLEANTVIGDYINMMRTTFDLNFGLNQAFNSMDTKKSRSIKKASL